MTNPLPFRPREPEVKRVVEPPQEITGYGWLYRSVELTNGNHQLQQLNPDGTWVPSTTATWADFGMGIAMRYLCPDPGRCCPD